MASLRQAFVARGLDAYAVECSAWTQAPSERSFAAQPADPPTAYAGPVQIDGKTASADNLRQ
jgi:hypothetical protein